MAGEVAINININIIEDWDYESSSSVRLCRICLEMEDAADFIINKAPPMESPCSCSGTIKYAHRECIQRWCNEKGNTVCELCSQKYEPGYTAPQLVGATTTVTIGGNAEAPTSSEDDDDDDDAEEEQENSTICSPAAAAADQRRRQRSSRCCTSLALIITLLLLVRNVYELIVDNQEENPPFSIPTVLILKASGIVVPMFVLSRILIALILNNSSPNYRHSHRLLRRAEGGLGLYSPA